MKNLFFFLLLMFVFFVGGAIIPRWKTLPFFQDKTVAIERPLFESCFIPTPYPLKNRSFTVIIIGRNNGGSLEKILNSVFTQNYENFRIVYVDDASDDGSFELARDLIYDMKNLIPTTLIHNEAPLGSLASLKSAIEECSDQEIVVVVDGHGWLAHEWVLTRLNQYYANSELWLTYGQFRNYPSFDLEAIPPSAEKQKAARSELPSEFHLQTFYAALFKKIAKDDLLCLGKHFEVRMPIAYMAPMMEMAESHVQYIPETLYVLHPEMEAVVQRDLQASLDVYIRSLPPSNRVQFLSDPLLLRENES